MVNGTVAIVTGGARGIGLACARQLARKGHHVIIVDLVEGDEAVAIIEGDGGTATAKHCDLESPPEIAQFATAVLGEFGRCDVLVNNAANQTLTMFNELDLETWQKIQAINVQAPMLLCSALVPGMAARGFGRIINIVSNTFWSPPAPGFVAYIASKGALIGLTRALALEVGDAGITVNAVAPGLTLSRQIVERPIDSDFYEAVRVQQSIKRSLDPDDIARLVAFLASDDAAMITGQAIRVDAGLVKL
jgi:NAD(P)-dependent dehydrogenase (short-subunit alcohol dehydrogenase family)